MLHVPGYALGAPLGDPERSRMRTGVAIADGRAVVLRRSAVSGLAARDALRSAVARVAGVRSAHLAVPCAVVATPDGLVVVYEADVVDAWSGTEPLPDPAAAVLTVVGGVADLHEAGLAHGALVPEAVWFRRDGGVLLACLPGPEEVDMSVDGKNLHRFAARLATGHAALTAALEHGDPVAAPRDLLSRLAPFAGPVRPEEAAAVPHPAPGAEPPSAEPPVAEPPVAKPVVAPARLSPAVVQSGPPIPPDLLRAPRPNRALAGDPQPLPRRGVARSVIAAVAAAVVVVAAAVTVLVGRASAGHSAPAVAVSTRAASTRAASSRAVSAPPSSNARSSPPRAASVAATTASPKPPAPSESATGDPHWIGVLTALDRERDGAFEAADAARLDRVYVAGSDAAATDRAALATLHADGMRSVGLALTVRDVRLVTQSARTAVLRVTDELPAYRIVAADGTTVRTQTGRGATTWLITLAKQSQGWRIATIEKPSG
jgi:hypothetical protein